MKYLMIETKDKKKFLTHEKHFLQIIEYAKTFSATLFLVESNDQPMELENIVTAICNSAYISPEYNYKIIETKIENRPIIENKRKNLIKNANQIKEYIETQFKNRNIVCINELKKKFKKYNLSDAAFCNHVKKVKTKIEEQGFKINKIGSGKYSIN